MDLTRSPEVGSSITVSILHSRLENLQVLEVEEGTLGESYRTFRDVSTIIQSRQNGPCRSCYPNVRVTL